MATTIPTVTVTPAEHGTWLIRCDRCPGYRTMRAHRASADLAAREHEQHTHAGQWRPGGRRLQDDLDELEHVDPAVAAAAAGYGAMVERLTNPDDHIRRPA